MNYFQYYIVHTISGPPFNWLFCVSWLEEENYQETNGTFLSQTFGLLGVWKKKFAIPSTSFFQEPFWKFKKSGYKLGHIFKEKARRVLKFWGKSLHDPLHFILKFRILAFKGRWPLTLVAFDLFLSMYKSSSHKVSDAKNAIQLSLSISEKSPFKVM